MYRLQCFGGAVVKAPDGQEVHLRSRKHLALLLYLAAHPNRAFGREDLARLLWDSEEALARHSLSQALYDIRRRLGAVHLQARRGMLSLREGGIGYEGAELEEAVRTGDLSRVPGLYRGGFAANLERLSVPFDRWLEGERSRYRTVAQMALRRYAEECDRHGRWGEMCLTALRLVRLEPLDEAAHRALMRALWLHGDQQSALQHYTDVEEFLVRELPDGISEQTLDLVQRIRSSRPASSTRGQSDHEEPPLVGREQEFKRLRTAMEALHVGEGGLVIVRGEAGIGKTRLLQELVRVAPMEGIVRLTSRCYSAERDVAYGPIVDAIEPLAEARARSDGPGEKRYYQLGHLFPDLFESSAEHDGQGVDLAIRRRRLYEEVADILRRSCSEGPILWILEDIQWIDASSASLLHYLVRRLQKSPLLVIASLRTEHELADAARALVDGDGTSAHATFLDLQPLSMAAIRELIKHASPESGKGRLEELAKKYSGGNPFYALEILRAAAVIEEDDEPRLATSRLSTRLRRLLEARLRPLEPNALRILEAVAVLDRHATVDDVALVLGEPVEAITRNAELLSSRDLLTSEGRRLQHRHDLMKEFVYGNLGNLRKTALHLAVGEVLSRDASVSSASLARHFQNAGDKARTYEFAFRAAEEALQSCAHSEAIGLAKLARSVATTPVALGAATSVQGGAELQTGQFETAKQHLKEALDLAGGRIDPAELLPLQLSLLRAQIETLAWQEALDTCETARSLLSKLPRDQNGLERQIELLALEVKLGLRKGDHDRAVRAVSSIDAILESAQADGQLSADAELEARLSQAMFATFAGQSVQAYQLMSRAPTVVTSPLRRIRWYLNQSVVALRLAKWDEAEVLASEGIALALDHNDLLYAANLRNNLSCVCYEQGLFEQALHHCMAAIELYEELAAAECTQISSLTNLGNIYFYTGDCTKAGLQFGRALALAEEVDDYVMSAELYASLGLISLEGGDTSSSLAHWESLRSELGRDKARATQDWSKIHWFLCFVEGYFLEDEEPVDQLRGFAGDLVDRDRLDALKLQCLSALFESLPTRKQLGAVDPRLRRSLLENRLLWFARAVGRWTQMTIQHFVDRETSLFRQRHLMQAAQSALMR